MYHLHCVSIDILRTLDILTEPVVGHALPAPLRLTHPAPVETTRGPVPIRIQRFIYHSQLLKYFILKSVYLQLLREIGEYHSPNAPCTLILQNCKKTLRTSYKRSFDIIVEDPPFSKESLTLVVLWIPGAGHVHASACPLRGRPALGARLRCQPDRHRRRRVGHRRLIRPPRRQGRRRQRRQSCHREGGGGL